MWSDSVAAVAIVRMRPRAIPLAMITMRKSTHGFRFLSYMSIWLRLAALRAAGAPLKYHTRKLKSSPVVSIRVYFGLIILLWCIATCKSHCTCIN